MLISTVDVNCSFQRFKFEKVNSSVTVFASRYTFCITSMPFGLHSASDTIQQTIIAKIVKHEMAFSAIVPLRNVRFLKKDRGTH